MNNEIKVTQLPSADTITQNDLLMIVQNNENKKATSNQIKDFVGGDLTNYYTKNETDTLLSAKANTSDLSAVATSGSYNDLSNKPTIPTKTSDLTNDSGYITKDVSDLTNYVKKTDYATSTKSGVIYAEPQSGFMVGPTGKPYPVTMPYSDYSSLTNTYFISKGTLENVISGKGLIDKDVDNLTNYVKKTDYATINDAGVIKANSQSGFSVGNTGAPYPNTYTYYQYSSLLDGYFISKGTLENVITGKDLTTKAYVDGLVGDINTALDTINGEVI